jgi:transposase
MAQLLIVVKAKIVGYLEIGWTGSEIAEIIPAHPSTVYRFISKYLETGIIARKKGSRRPSICTDDVKKIVDIEVVSNPRTSFRKLSKCAAVETHKDICHMTIKRYLNKQEIFSYSPINKPLLKPEHITKRLSISEKVVIMKEDDVKRVIFTDESKFNLFYSDGSKHVLRKAGCGLKSEYLNKTVKGGGGSVMVWACFSYHGVGRIEIISGKMNAAVYVDILSRNLFESAEKMKLKTFIFQQDNDPKHTSGLAKRFFSENNISVMDWPSQSPDMNPIEHLWAYVKIRVAEKRPKNLTELKRIIIEEWNNIPLETCQDYALSFKKRGLEVNLAGGEHTYY